MWFSYLLGDFGSYHHLFLLIYEDSYSLDCKLVSKCRWLSRFTGENFKSHGGVLGMTVSCEGKLWIRTPSFRFDMWKEWSEFMGFRSLNDWSESIGDFRSWSSSGSHLDKK
jgi:hypothetical protein